MPRIGVIGGTGLLDPTAFGGIRRIVEITPYGPAVFFEARLNGTDIAFLPRHGPQHTVPPHRVNYRANIWALWNWGVEQVIATAAVGGIDAELKPGDFVIVDQCIDFTKDRPSTFADDTEGPVCHVDFTHPYCPRLRDLVIDSCTTVGVRVRSQGCYVCAQGPRFETPAEIRMFGALGATVVGMTGMPEAALAREAGLCYAAICVVTNQAAGFGHTPLTHEEVVRQMEASRVQLLEVMGKTVKRAEGSQRTCGCADARVLEGRPEHGHG
ncbi:MAG: S-methyl-5'-thioadenosine phosphorylase [Bacillota bacterium]